MESQNELFAALAKAQGQYRTVAASRHVNIRMKDGGSYSYNYATLASIMDMLRGPFSANGLSIAQLIANDELVTILAHASGQTITATVPLPKGGDIKGFGANLTYLRRYSITAIAGVAIDEEDDESVTDGKIEQKPRQQAKAERTKPPQQSSQPDSDDAAVNYRVEKGKVVPIQPPATSELDAAFPRQKTNGDTHKAQRPLTPEQVKTFSTSRPKWTIAKAPSEQQATYAFTSLSKACEGDDDCQHIVNEYLFGVQSQKDLTAGQCSFIIDWCGAKAENEYTVNPDTTKEIRAIMREVVKVAGQTDMFEQQPEMTIAGIPEEEIAF